MNTILTKITQGVNLNKERTPYIYAVALMGLFTFLFLGAEYLFVDVLSHIVSEDRTVLAQNYALGISAAGFALYPLFNRFCKDRLKAVCSVIIGFCLFCVLFSSVRGRLIQPFSQQGLFYFCCSVWSAAVFFMFLCV